MLLKYLTLLYALFISFGANGSEIAFSDATHIQLSGEIKPGDANKVVALYRSNPIRFLKSSWSLNSNGGDMAEAIKIGTMVKEFYQFVEVLGNGQKCASACFFIYISSVNRSALHLALGIHRPYFSPANFANLPPDQAKRRYDSMASKVREFLNKNEVPNDLVEKMFSLSSEEIYWLSMEDRERIGTRPPWYDQYILSKCGFNSRKEYDAASRLVRGDESQRPIMMKWAKCEGDAALDQGIENSVKYWKRR